MRKHYLDNARWLTVVIVVIYHVIFMYNNEGVQGVVGGFGGNQWWDAFQYLVYPWFMVLLFLISGMSSRFYLEKHTDKEFRKSRTDKLLIPSTVGLLVFQWICGYVNMSISSAFEQMQAVPAPALFLIMGLSGTGPLWYIQVLWVFSMLLTLIRKAEKDRLYQKCEKIPALAIALAGIPLVWAAAQVLNTPVIVVYRWGVYLLSFLIGYFLLSHEHIMEELMKYWAVFAGIAVILGGVNVFVYFGENYSIAPVRDSFLSMTYAWIASLAVLTCCKKFFNFRNAFTDFMKAQSWGLYVFHYLCIAAPAWLMQNRGIPAAVQYLICTVLGFAGSWGLFAVLSRIPCIRFLVLGIQRKAVKQNVQG